MHMPRRNPPTSESEYIDWIREVAGADFTGATQRLYKSNAAVALLAAQEHIFFSNIENFLRSCEQEYVRVTGSSLIMNEYSVKLVQKSYESAVNKTYRINIVNNRRLPGEPADRWVTPENWFAKLNDIIRGTIVCKYIDGPKFLAEKLEAYANHYQLENRYVSQQRDDGYYAYHFYVKVPVELNNARMESDLVNLDIELILTTQLQEILYMITHRFYEDTRNQRLNDAASWKWDVKSNRFKAGYLSHTLHLLEAIIMELRDTAPHEVNGMIPGENDG